MKEISSVIESIFKFLVWSSFLAILTSSLRLQFELESYMTVIIIFFLLSSLCLWALFNIALPTANIFYPNIKYSKAANALIKLPSKEQRKKVLFELLKYKESWLCLVLFVALFTGMNLVFGVLLEHYAKL